MFRGLSSWCAGLLLLATISNAFAQDPAKAHKGLNVDPGSVGISGVFYENDFSYLDDPDNTTYLLGDSFKQRHFGCIIADFGGEYRVRPQGDNTILRNSDFILHRTRLFADARLGEFFRFYGEAIDAVSDHEDTLPGAVEENRFDALNLFGEARLLNTSRGEVWFRAGRQELIYGAERLVSPLEWSNTRRTFDGYKVFWRGDDWNVDAWWTHPVPFGQHINAGQTDHNMDRPDYSQQFAGIWATKKSRPDRRWDFYYLWYKEVDPSGLITDPFNYNTLGARYSGKSGQWLWDLEAAYQNGYARGVKQSAGMYTLGFGRKLDMCWDPVVWLYYDWASGSPDVAAEDNTFNQLFPLGHAWLGWLDLVGRQNIEDINCKVVLKPHEKFTFITWVHVFKLQQENDSLYDARGVAITTDPTGAAGSDVGQELDMILVYKVKPRFDIAFGYSHMYNGRFLLNQYPGRTGSDRSYIQSHIRF